MEKNMQFKVYSRHLKRYDSYTIKKTTTGWYVEDDLFGQIKGNCDKRGDPYLFENLNHDYVNYPEYLGGYMKIYGIQCKKII